MDYTKKLNNNIKYIYLYNFFHSLIFAYVIERLFWRSRGISIVETVYLEAIYAVVIIVLEVPSGLWADIWRRKNLIVIGQVLSMLEMLILVFANSFLAFALVMGIAALSGALRSGSSNALIYDTLTELGRKGEFEKIRGRVKAFEFTSHTLAALAGGFIAQYSELVINYKLSVVSGCFAIVFSLLLIEPRRDMAHVSDKGNENLFSINRYRQYFVETFKSSKVVINKNDYLRYVIVVGIVIGSTMTYMWEFWQNYVEAVGIEMMYFGFVSAICSMGTMVSAARAYTVIDLFKRKKINKKRLYQASMIIIGVSFVGLYFIRNVACLVILLILNLVAGLYETALEGDIHHSVESNNRATVESIYSMLLRIVTIVVGVAFGFVSEYLGIFSGFGMLGLIILIFQLVLQKSSNNEVTTMK